MKRTFLIAFLTLVLAPNMVMADNAAPSVISTEKMLNGDLPAICQQRVWDEKERAWLVDWLIINHIAYPVYELRTGERYVNWSKGI